MRVQKEVSKEAKRIGITSLKTICESQSHRRRLRRTNEGAHAQSFGYLSAEPKSPVKISIPSLGPVRGSEAFACIPRSENDEDQGS
jgi:hypothetical protein